MSHKMKGHSSTVNSWITPVWTVWVHLSEYFLIIIWCKLTVPINAVQSVNVFSLLCHFLNKICLSFNVRLEYLMPCIYTKYMLLNCMLLVKISEKLSSLVFKKSKRVLRVWAVWSVQRSFVCTKRQAVLTSWEGTQLAITLLIHHYWME